MVELLDFRSKLQPGPGAALIAAVLDNAPAAQMVLQAAGAVTETGGQETGADRLCARMGAIATAAALVALARVSMLHH